MKPTAIAMKTSNGIYSFKHGVALFIAGLMIAGFPSQLAQASPNLDELRKHLETITKGFHGKIGVSLHHLKTNDRVDLRGDEQFDRKYNQGRDALCRHGKS